MKNHAFALAFLSAGSLLAMQPKYSLTCDDHGGDRRRSNFCEIREATVSAAGGPISIDGRENGGVSVKGWDRNEVLVRSQVRTTANTDAEARDLARQVVVHSIGAQVRSEGPARDRDHQWNVSYEVFVPARSALTVQTTNGGIHIADVTGNLEFKGVNGGVSLARVAGKVHGETTNGGVSIELTGNRWEGEGMDVKTVNGGLTLHVVKDFSAQLDVRTQNGGIHSDIPIAMPANRHDHHVTATLGSGGAMLHLTTTNGGVSVVTGSGSGGNRVRHL